MRIDLIHEDVNAEDVKRFGIHKGQKFTLTVVKTAAEEEIPENLRWFADEDPVLKLEKTAGNASRDVVALTEGVSEIRICEGDTVEPKFTLWVTVFSSRAAGFGVKTEVASQ